MDYSSIKFETESDVEQKFIYNLLINTKPLGLGFINFNIKLKEDIRKIKIDKGLSSKYYFPDYAIVVNGLPVLIVEAKNPYESVTEGFREARLYANEINASFPSKINPCIFIISSNGLETHCGYWDDETPKYILKQNNYTPIDNSFSEFIEEFSLKTLIQITKKIKTEFRGNTKFLKPTYMLGGHNMRGQSVGENSFGVNLALEYKYLFNPETEEEREDIINNAYVVSRKRLSHVTPIDRLIRSIITPSQKESREISDTSSPNEIFEQLKDKKKVKKQICILIGSVGSGKSTFIDFLHKKALPSDLISETFWLSLDLNQAPINKEKIYNWLLDEAINKLIVSHKEYDFSNLDFIKKVFARELKLKQSILTLLGENTSSYNAKLYDIITELLNDKEKYLKALIQFLFLDKDKLLIFILDNCDKRNRDEQLLMFEVANWLKAKYTLMVFLPLRETTFDLYKNEPPLDTVIKDLVFRIDPPLLVNVLQRRIEFALREIENSQTDFSYVLPNGSIVRCRRNEIGNYLNNILHTLFKNDFFRKLMIGLTGRNIRKGLEIFLDFCKSGHFTEDIIFTMRTSSRIYEIPNHLITRILLRGKRLYYDESASRIKNIFASSIDDPIPDPYVRFSILSWLKERQRVPGPTKIKGYHKTSTLISCMTTIGHEEAIIIRELEFLLFEDHIISESQENKFDPNNLISITSAGIIHLDLLSSIDYIASISEDSLFRINDRAQVIADNISGRNYSTPFSKHNTLENASTFIDYLKEYKDKYWFNPSSVVECGDNRIDSCLNECNDLIDRAKNTDAKYIDWEIVKLKYPPNSIHEGVIVSIQPYGLIVELGLNATGLVHRSHLTSKTNEDNKAIFETGDYIDVQVIDFNEKRLKFSLALV